MKIIKTVKCLTIIIILLTIALSKKRHHVKHSAQKHDEDGQVPNQTDSPVAGQSKPSTQQITVPLMTDQVNHRDGIEPTLKVINEEEDDQDDELPTNTAELDPNEESKETFINRGNGYNPKPSKMIEQPAKMNDSELPDELEISMTGNV